MNAVVVVLVNVVVTVPMAITGVCLMLHVDRKIKARGYLLVAMGSTVQSLLCAVTGNRFMASIDAATAALAFYCWWNNGGGDGMRRRFKAWAESLGPRMAPQGA